ncbi:parallel beta-helix repeat-containing protein [Methanobacterium formicicum DSM 3637]|uniref:Parallel beta-helix repeat-containing protein n=1 Tax=Methanobacterium formicicum (strain DSM 3637 / PP1) TaxID=1204725 RepID=K2R375_METFP|nr:parallel beta-helix repeat-containing protein [Methanobacterium formicicum DSM 3637]
MNVSAVSAENSTNFTVSEISNASVAVQNHIDTNKKLPDNVTIGNQTISTAQYLHLAVDATNQIQQNNSKPISLENDQAPRYSEESLGSGSISRSDYLDFANRVDDYMNNNQEAPPYGYIGLGKISYQSQVYLFSRILSIYYTNGTLPTYVSLKPFTPSNIPILYTPPTTFTPAQIVSAAVTLKDTIETTKTIPTTITINGITIYTAQFLHLATQATTQLANKNYDPILLQNDDQPTYSEEQLNSGTMTQNDYLDFAQRITNHMNQNHQAPPYGYIGLGKISYQSQVYLFTRILTIYNSTGSLPVAVTMKPFTSNNIPILYTPPTTFTPAQIASAASELKNTIETTKTIPTTITINGITIYTAQFLQLATQATTQLANNNTTPILLTSNEKPSYTEEQLNSGTMTQNDYLDFAQRITGYMNDNHQAPPYGYIGLGKISYQSQVYLFARVLSIYNSSGSLPVAVAMNPFTSSNIPILYTPPTTFTPAQIASAASELKNTIETTKTIPTTITINGITIYTAQFLHLAVKAVNQIENNDYSPILLQSDSQPTYSEESFKSGIMTVSNFLDFAQRINDYMNDNHQAPPYGYIGLGKISYQSQVYLFSRILDYYNSTSTLPVNIAMKPWNSGNIPITGINITFTIDQVAETATGVKNNFDIYSSLPETADVAGITVNISQFLYLLISSVTQINSGLNHAIILEDFSMPSASYEQMNSGSLLKADYIDFANRILDYMNTNQQPPSYGVTGLGRVSFHSQVYAYSQIMDYYKNYRHLPDDIYLKSWKTITYLGSTDYGEVVRLGPYGNLMSPVKIAYIVGVHPIEQASHQAMMETIGDYDNSLQYCYYIYHVTVTRDAGDYDKGRMNGQLLANSFVVPDIISKKFQLAIDIHSNVGNWAYTRFVFSPVSGTSSESFAWAIKNGISWLTYFSPPGQTSPAYVTVPLIQAGIPAILYETYTYEDYGTTRTHANEFARRVDSLSF